MIIYFSLLEFVYASQCDISLFLDQILRRARALPNDFLHSWFQKCFDSGAQRAAASMKSCRKCNTDSVYLSISLRLLDPAGFRCSLLGRSQFINIIQ